MTVDREKVAAQYVEVLFDDAFNIRERQASLNEERKGNRDELRNAERAGRLTDEQSTLLAELYPVRVRSTDEDEPPAE
jgi:hypothetical protein